MKNVAIKIVSSVLGLILLTVFILSYFYHKADDFQTASQNAAFSSDELLYTLNSIVNETDFVETLFINNPCGVSSAGFKRTAQNIYKRHTGIRAVEFMTPDGKIDYFYPSDGSNLIADKNFLTDPDRGPEVNFAIKTKQTTVSGPYNLYRGGYGLVGRNPVFYTDDRGNEHFLGIAAIVLNLPTAIDLPSFKELINNGYEYRVWCVNEHNENITIIQSDSFKKGKKTIEVPIPVPNHEWYLSLYPRKGWVSWYHMLTLLVAEIAFYCSYFLLVHNYLHRVRSLENINKARTDFLARMSHDMRTPMNAIINTADFGLKESESTRLTGYFRQIKESSLYLLGLQNDLLDMQKLEKGVVPLHPEVIVSGRIIKNVLAIMDVRAREKNITFVTSFKNNFQDCYIYVDKLRFNQILLNILNNAIKYTPPGGRVEWTAVSKRKEDGNYEVKHIIRDNGVGMSEAFQKHLFEPFTQEPNSQSVREGGAGLGLAITKNLIGLLGGTISCQSTLGNGSLFTVILPVQAAAEEQIAGYKTAVSVKSTGYHLQNKKVLLCEDNDLNLTIAVRILEEAGMTVDTAADGSSGVEKIRQALELQRAGTAGYKMYDGILMDVRMPVMDGLTATREIRKLDTKIPIVALSANAYGDDVQRSLAAGMNAHIAKPIDKAELFQTLSRLFNNNPSEASL
jgi:signal transduction histidine kinase/CheY-like chemotaxis protein/sensor domain CHASE-containing protein